METHSSQPQSHRTKYGPIHQALGGAGRLGTASGQARSQKGGQSTWVSDVYVCMHKHQRLCVGVGVGGGMLPHEIFRKAAVASQPRARVDVTQLDEAVQFHLGRHPTGRGCSVPPWTSPNWTRLFSSTLDVTQLDEAVQFHLGELCHILHLC